MRQMNFFLNFKWKERDVVRNGGILDDFKVRLGIFWFEENESFKLDYSSKPPSNSNHEYSNKKSYKKLIMHDKKNSHKNKTDKQNRT